MTVLIILKTIFLYIKHLFYLKCFGTECAPYSSACLHICELFCFLVMLITLLILNFLLKLNYQYGLFYPKQLTRGQRKYFDANNSILESNKIPVNLSVNLKCAESKSSKPGD